MFPDLPYIIPFTYFVVFITTLPLMVARLVTGYYRRGPRWAVLSFGVVTVLLYLLSIKIFLDVLIDLTT